MADSYPNGPGYKATGTSADAAAAIAPDNDRLEQLTLASLRRAPKTMDEVAEDLGIDRLSIRPRGSALKEKGLIKATGKKRKNRSGRPANVWMVVEMTHQGKLFETARDATCL